MLMANAVMGAAAETPGKESKAMEAYAEAPQTTPSNHCRERRLRRSRAHHTAQGGSHSRQSHIRPW